MCFIIPKGMVIISQLQVLPLNTEHALPNKGLNISEASDFERYSTPNNGHWWLAGWAFLAKYLQNQRMIENAAPSVSRSTSRNPKPLEINPISHDKNLRAATSLVSFSDCPQFSM